MRIGAIIQARVGSSRLPNKVVKPFFGQQSLLDICIKKMQSLPYPVIVATSINKDNDVIAHVAKKHGCLLYRGSEHDVLSRFVEAAKTYSLGFIIRVCSDNPFIQLPLIRELVQSAENVEFDADYFTHTIRGKPAMQTHLGIFTELVRSETLLHIGEQIADPFYHEHVTNYIYQHPQSYKIHKLPFQSNVPDITKIRLTIDTEGDFHDVAQIYQTVSQRKANPSVDEILHTARESSSFGRMQNRISENIKS